MGQQSNNNMDALFQKAAEEYPLKTDNKNWDAVSTKLHSYQLVSSVKKSRKWQYAALLLLLLAGSFFMINSLNKKSSNSYSHQQNSLTQKNNNKNSQQKTTIQKNNNKNNQNYLLTKIEKKSLVQLSGNRNKIQSGKISKNYMHLSKPNTYFKDNTLSSANGSDFSNQGQLSQQLSLPFNDPGNKINKSAEIKHNNAGTANKNIIKNSKQANKEADVSNKQSAHIKLMSQSKTFYGTFFFSPDFSTVKFQHINKPGYSIGIALGYRINNRISAEIGLKRIHNNFFSRGKYFDKSNLKLKSTTIINAVNGNGKLTEVPFDIRYNILKNNDHFFATAGTTVALVTHREKYNYDVTKNGSPDNISRKFNSLTGTKFFSSINVSIGYQVSVSDIFKLKVEPYYQAPIKGLGIGNVPVSNFGVNLGIIKDLK